MRAYGGERVNSLSKREEKARRKAVKRKARRHNKVTHHDQH